MNARRLALLLLVGTVALAQDSTNFPVIGKVHRSDPRLDELIDPSARLEVLASGFDWTEGLWIREGAYLRFSDIPRNSVYKWKEGIGVSHFMKPSGYTGIEDYGAEPGSNGLILDPAGLLVLCEHGDRRISVLEPQANTLARERGILSGANFLDITDQSLTTDVDFCQVFQSTSRHSRQKWFEIASFPIFNVGGLGSLEELGIMLCNMKLSILEPIPVILFDTEGGGRFWDGIQSQIAEMVRKGRAPAWIADNIVATDDPETVIRAYRERLQLF